MLLDVTGHPLASRLLQVEIATAPAGRWALRGELADLRKCGFVPVAGHLQTSGLVHHMRVRATLDPERRVLEEISAEMPRVALEPSDVTGGESCRDPIRRIEALAGLTLEEAFPRGLSAAIGGPLGCSHVLALARLVGASARAALAFEASAVTDPPDARPAGDRVFARSLVLDGFDDGRGAIVLATQLTDLHGSPAPSLAPPMDRFAGESEWRIQAIARVDSAELGSLEGHVRRRNPATVASAGWESLGARLEPLVGHSLLRDFAARCFEAIGDDADLGGGLDALLQVAPFFLQCLGSLSEAWPAASQQQRAIVGTGGLPDTCYMWRSEGVLGRRLSEEARAGLKLHSARKRTADG